jgi:hypothetical protein
MSVVLGGRADEESPSCLVAGGLFVDEAALNDAADNDASRDVRSTSASL